MTECSVVAFTTMGAGSLIPLYSGRQTAAQVRVVTCEDLQRASWRDGMVVVDRRTPHIRTTPMHPVVLLPFTALLWLARPDEQKDRRSPCACEATVVVVADTTLAHHPGFEGMADTSATYRLGFLNATGIGKSDARRLMKRMGLTTGAAVKCDQAFLRSLCQHGPSALCLETVEIQAVGPLHFLPDGSLNITLRYRSH